MPNRVFDFNLSPYDLAVFCLIARLNPSFPSYSYFQKKLQMGRVQVWKSLCVLRQCNMISWDKRLGQSNEYIVMPEGVWKAVDNLKRTSGNQFTIKTVGSMPGELPPVHHMNSNNTNLNNTNLKRESGLKLIVDNLCKKNKLE